MKLLRMLVILLLLNIVCFQAVAQEINVCINVRGKTGLENRLKDILSNEFKTYKRVLITEDKEKSHLYLDCTLVEQEQIKFFALGVCIAYHIREKFYSRPTSDVAQFGEGRMKDVCHYLVRGIDKTFLEPLRHPPQE